MSIQHRNAGAITSVMAACLIGISSCGQAGSNSSAYTKLAASNQAVSQETYGPAVDRIIIERRSDQAKAIADVVAGRADLILNPLPPAVARNIGSADLDKLQVKTVPAESWSILLNPIPNAAPYTWTSTSGQTSFNPLAIRELRYALNWLFDRQRLVTEVLGGRGVAGYTPLPPGLSSTARFDALPAGLGMTAAGDENRAIDEIVAAMDAAAGLPENEGRLLRATDGFWQFDGKPVTIKFLIRADEPAGRLPAGRYLASQLEKTGLRVQRLERDRSALTIAYFSDPAELAFHIYTEAWAPRTGKPSWDLTIGQQYAPHYGNLPGGANPAWWQYRNPELDRLAGKSTDSLKTMEEGLKEAVRIYLVFQHDSFIANKGRFDSPLVLDTEAGITGASLRTARILAETGRGGGNTGNGDGDGDGDGKKILRVLHVHAGGNIDLASWDPGSPEGFVDTYSMTIAELVSEATPVLNAGLSINVGRSGPDEDPVRTFFWHNGIELGTDDIRYETARGIKLGTDWSTRIRLPWDLYVVLGQLVQEKPAGELQAGLSLVSPGLVDTILVKYRELLQRQWVPPELVGLVDMEQAARRYNASINFIESYGHALISNGPFVLAKLDRATGTAVLEAFQDYPYGNNYPIRSTKD